MTRPGWLIVGALAGCAVDADLDGLSEQAERELGTDPTEPDTDGDGLRDGAEVAYGSDPLVQDTDGDGYTDRDEVHEGSDPTDASSRIYAGGWPYLFDKSGIPAAEAGHRLAVGRTVPPWTLVDQYGDAVDLYDFYNDDVPVVIDLSAEWCPPCRDLSSWIAGGDDPGRYGVLWSSGPRRVRRGHVRWLTVLSEDLDHGPPDPGIADRWDAAYPSEHVVVLSDQRQLAPDYTMVAFWPALVLLEPDLRVSDANGTRMGDLVTVLRALNERFP